MLSECTENRIPQWFLLIPWPRPWKFSPICPGSSDMYPGLKELRTTPWLQHNWIVFADHLMGITLSTKVHLVNDMVFPVVMYGCESWAMRKAEHWRIDAFELWCWRRLFFFFFCTFLHAVLFPIYSNFLTCIRIHKLVF